MSGGCVHIVGAGLAGLAAAVELVGQGRHVRVHEAAPHAGGRCRSFEDPALGCLIDNGNHLLLSGNTEALRYLDAIGAAGTLQGPEEAAFPFLDLASGARWTVCIGAGRWPGWIFDASRRVPGTTAWDYLRALRLARASDEDTVAEVLGGMPLFTRFWEPLAVSILNTEPEHAAAKPLWRVLCETVARGGRASRPLIARRGLGESFIAPALTTLARAGVDVGFGRRLRSVGRVGDVVRSLAFSEGTLDLAAGDAVVLAVPPWVAADVVPGLDVPDQHRAIVNGHFLLPAPHPGTAFLGLLGGMSQWLFVRGEVASITVSAADALADRPAEELAVEMWQEVCAALDLGATPLPAHRILKEKRATIAQTPEQLRRRPPLATRWRNLVLAGDWTDTGLPATIEGAVRSGRRAARALDNSSH